MDAAVRFPTSPKPGRAAPVKLSRRMSVEQAFEAIARSCVGQIAANEDGVARCRDAESLHQMRVGLRRLAAARTLFCDVIPTPQTIEDHLDWLMNELGPVRDWDVLADATLTRAIEAMPDEESLFSLQQAVRARLPALHERASAAVSSSRYRELLDGLSHWIDTRGWRQGLAGKARMRLKLPVENYAYALLAKENERLLRRGKKLKDADAGARHRVRIAAKRVRYAAEFFASLFPDKKVRPYVRALRRLQDELGWLNDAAVARQLLDELDQAGDRVGEGTALLRGYLAAASEGSERRIRKPWKRFTATEAPH